MQDHTHQGATPMHGCKVAIGSLASTVMYERVLAMSVEDIVVDEAAIRAYWPTWESVEQSICSNFTDTSLAEQVIKQSRDKYLEAGALVERLQRLKDNWGDLCQRLEKQIIPADQLQKMLAEAGAPHVPEDIGIDRERLHRSHGQAQMIRSRYTVLDLIAEAGWWESCVDAQFEEGGFWA